LEIELSKKKIFQYNSQNLQQQVDDLKYQIQEREIKMTELEQELLLKNNSIVDLERRNEICEAKLSKKKKKNP